jgi:hypothetical protein
MTTAAQLTPDQIRRAAGVIIREIVWLHRQAERVALIPATDATDRADIASRADDVRATREAMLAVLPLIDASAAERVYAEIPGCRRTDTPEGVKIALRESAEAASADSGHGQNVGGA